MSEAAAARIAGFSPDALLNYKKSDAKLVSQMEFERAKLQEELTVKALKGSGDSPRDARETLAMHFPREFNPRVALEISGRDGGAIVTRDDTMAKAIMESPAALTAYHALLAEIGGVIPKASARVDVDASSASGTSSEAQPAPAKASAPLRLALGPGSEPEPQVELWVPPLDRPDPDAEWWCPPQSSVNAPRNVTPPSEDADDDEDGSELL
jgi:hypothetical protein